MVLGARPIGTMSLGDSTAQATPAAAPTGNVLSPAGIASAEAFGAATVTLGPPPQTVSPPGIASAEAFGTAIVVRIITPPGIATFEAFGFPGITKGPVPAPAGTPGREHHYLLVVVDMYGNKFAELPTATITDVSWELNGFGGIDFTIPVDAEGVEHLTPIVREVQAWRDGALLQWAVLVKPQATERTLSYQCPGVGWHLQRRFYGRTDRTNLLPALDSGAWEAVGVAADINPPRRLSRDAVMLTQANDDRDTYFRFVLRNYQATPIGSVVVMAGWALIDDAAWIGPAQGARGLYLNRLASGVSQQIGEGDSITHTTRRGSWVRFETLVNMPPSVVEDLEFRLYAVGKIITWSAVTATLMESLSSVEGPGDFSMDQAKLVEMSVQHAQDAAYNRGTVNLATNCPPTGIERERHFQFAEHENIWAGIRSFTELENGIDVGTELTSTTRTLTTYYPRRGVERPELRLEWGRNVSSFTYSWDGERAANSVTVLGDGDGPDREEGGGLDLTKFGGIALEHVESAPAGSPVDTLDQRAAEALRVLSRPEILSVTCQDPEDQLIPPIGLREGDVVPASIRRGWVQIESRWRMIGARLDPESETLTVELNPA